MSDPDRRPYPDGFDDDAIFADIVAHLNDDAPAAERADPPTGEAASDVATNPVTGGETEEEARSRPAELPPGESESAPGGPDHWPFNRPPPLPISDNPQDRSAAQSWRAHEVDDEYEEHFEPPPVTPLPAGDLSFWAIIAGMGVGPLLLLYIVFFNRDAGTFWILTAIGMSVGGFALLVSRMPGHQGDDDDGARL